MTSNRHQLELVISVWYFSNGSPPHRRVFVTLFDPIQKYPLWNQTHVLIFGAPERTQVQHWGSPVQPVPLNKCTPSLWFTTLVLILGATPELCVELTEQTLAYSLFYIYSGFSASLCIKIVQIVPNQILWVCLWVSPILELYLNYLVLVLSRVCITSIH